MWRPRVVAAERAATDAELANIATDFAPAAAHDGAVAMLGSIADALDVPSVVVSCGADASRFAPADPLRHVMLWQPAPCRPCQHDECPVGHPCATALPVRAVDRAVRQQLGATA